MRLLAFLSRSYWLDVLRRCAREVGLVGLESIGVAAWCGWATPLVVGVSAGALLTLRRTDAERRGPRTA